MACAALIVAGTMASCTPDMDGWGTDSAFSRLFSSSSVSVTPGDSWAEVTFATVQNAQKYQIQLMKCTDPDTEAFNDSVAEDAAGLINMYTTQSPDTIRGLMGETKYKLRIRSIADGQNNSKWSYYSSTTGKSYFTTDKEQIFNDITTDDRGETAIHLSWTPGAEVDKITYTDATTGITSEHAVTDAEKAAGSATIEGLTPATSYTFAIYNGTSKRGDLTASTMAQVPSGDYKIYLDNSVTTIDNDYLKEVAAMAADGKTNYSVTLAIPEGQTVTLGAKNESGEDASVKIPDGMSLTLFGIGGTGKVVMPKALNIEGKHNTVKFQQLTVTGQTKCDALVNQEDATNVEELAIEDCTIDGFTSYLVQLKGSNCVINKLTLKNTIVQNLCKDASGNDTGNAMIYCNASGSTINNLEISACTFNRVHCGSGKPLVYARYNDMKSILIEKCTFYDISQQYLLDGNKTQKVTGGIVYNNNIFGKCTSAKVDGMTKRWVNTNISGSGNYYLSDWGQTKLENVTPFSAASSDVFTDPENGNFTITSDDLKGYGDPRWY